MSDTLITLTLCSKVSQDIEGLLSQQEEKLNWQARITYSNRVIKHVLIAYPHTYKKWFCGQAAYPC